MPVVRRWQREINQREAEAREAHQCFYADGCTAPAVDGTGYCVLHLGLLRAQRNAELFKDADPAEPQEPTESDREKLGQLVLLDAYREAQREGTAA